MKWISGLVLSMAAMALCSGDVLNLFTGKEQLLEGEGSWQLTAEHGRVLAQGMAENGKIIINLPKTAPGTVLDATLKNQHNTVKVKLHAPEILPGTVARIDLDGKKITDVLTGYGITDPKNGKEKIIFTDALEKCTAETNFLFTGKYDFPLKIGSAWQTISLFRAKIPGSLGVIISKEEQIADINGNAGYLELKNNDRRVIVLGPDFDPADMENALLIKKIIKKEKGK